MRKGQCDDDLELSTDANGRQYGCSNCRASRRKNIEDFHGCLGRAAAPASSSQLHGVSAPGDCSPRSAGEHGASGHNAKLESEEVGEDRSLAASDFG